MIGGLKWLMAGEGRVVLAGGGEVEYDWLVLALGADSALTAVPGAREHALPFYNYEDALQVPFVHPLCRLTNHHVVSVVCIWLLKSTSQARLSNPHSLPPLMAVQLLTGGGSHHSAS